jgi:uncharacterized cupredoxin-like copper-binding protein
VRVQLWLRRRMSRITMLGCIFICSVSLVLYSSCTSSGSSTATVATQAAATFSDVVMLTVDMYDNYYGDADNNLTNPPVWAVQKGADVVATLTNHGRRNHNWAIVKLGAPIPIPYEEGQSGDIVLHGIGMVYGNSQTTITFTAPEPGEYMVICTVSGHYPAMQGRLLVTSPTDQ